MSTEERNAEHEAISGVYTLAMTQWPEGTRAKLISAQNVAVHRATLLREAVDSGDMGKQWLAQGSFDAAIADYRAVMLSMFELEDTATASEHCLKRQLG